MIDEETPKIGDDVKVSYLFDDSKDVAICSAILATMLARR